jgi:3'(2'), 5'-bisphosphate nucleotidase
VHIDDARIAVSKSRTSPVHTRALARFSAAQLLPIGSAGLKAAAVAEGSAEVYLAPEFAGFRWDSCAPEAIIGALGGAFTDVTGVALDYRAAGAENSRGAVAASVTLHQAVIGRLSDPLR